MALIEIDNLSVTYRAKGRDVRAVEGVSLKVEARDSFGLVGESGSGKSTILRAICGLAPVTGGTIRIAGKANVANSNIITPRGMATKVTAEQYAALQKNHVFALQKENGFLTAEQHKEDAEKVAANMQGRDKSAPDTTEDMLLGGDVDAVDGTVIKKKERK